MIIIVLKHIATNEIVKLNAADITVEDLGKFYTSNGYEIVEYQHHEEM